MGGRQPECMLDGPAVLSFARLAERWRARRFLPRSAKIGRPKDRWAEVTGACGRKHRPAIARIQHHVMDDLPKEMRPVGSPIPAGLVAMIEPGALARGDKQQIADRLCPARLHALREPWSLIYVPLLFGCGASFRPSLARPNDIRFPCGRLWARARFGDQAQRAFAQRNPLHVQVGQFIPPFEGFSFSCPPRPGRWRWRVLRGEWAFE